MTEVTRKRLVTILPMVPDTSARKVVITTTSDGRETPNVMHGEVGVTFRWERGSSITYPWTSIFALYEEPIDLGFELHPDYGLDVPERDR